MANAPTFATTSLERLRLATALAHTVPGATMRVVCHSGQHVNVGVHPGADLDACAMRKVVIASGRPEVRDCSELVADITVAGALQHLGGGVYRRVFDDVEQRWLATLLPPETIAELLDLCGPAGTPDDAMHGCLKPDGDLAVTCLVITANSREYQHLLDEIAASASAAILVEELLRSTRQGALSGSDDASDR